jgi:hypothetical protein
MASANNQTGLSISLALAQSHHGLTPGVFRVTSPTLPQVALCDRQKDFFAVNDPHAAIRWLVLGGPWKACLQPHKISQSPTRRVFKKAPQLVGFLVFNLVGVLVEPL